MMVKICCYLILLIILEGCASKAEKQYNDSDIIYYESFKNVQQLIGHTVLSSKVLVISQSFIF